MMEQGYFCFLKQPLLRLCPSPEPVMPTSADQLRIGATRSWGRCSVTASGTTAGRFRATFAMDLLLAISGIIRASRTALCTNCSSNFRRVAQAPVRRFPSGVVKRCRRFRALWWRRSPNPFWRTMTVIWDVVRRGLPQTRAMAKPISFSGIEPCWIGRRCHQRGCKPRIKLLFTGLPASQTAHTNQHRPEPTVGVVNKRYPKGSYRLPSFRPFCH